MNEILRFEDFIGQDHIKDFLKDAAMKSRAPHAMIIEGERGMGKRTLAKLFAMSVLCDANEDKPCGKCRSCNLAALNNHPDIITITHEKPNVVTVDEVRSQIVGDVLIKPYYNKKKIYIFPDAGKMNVNAQNALLKTVEEPPEYVITILLTENKTALLPTILSRCVGFSLNPLSDKTVTDHLISRYDVEPDKAAVCASLSRGSIGRAAEMAESEEFDEIYSDTVELLKNAEKEEFYRIFAKAKEMASRKEELDTILDLILLWYRDLLMSKASGDPVSLTFKKETGYIVSKAQNYEYEEINSVFEAIRKTKERLQHNANTEASMDMMLLSIMGGG